VGSEVVVGQGTMRAGAVRATAALTEVVMAMETVVVMAMETVVMMAMVETVVVMVVDAEGPSAAYREWPAP